MTPDERQMIAGLFDRMRQQGAIDKDRDADALIRDTVRQMPDAPYIMVQSVLVQEMALQQSEGRIRELEDRIQALEAQAKPQQNSGSFLGGLFGGGAAAPARPASVPVAGRQQSGGFGAQAPRAAAPSPWGGQPQQPMAPQQGYGQQGYGQPMPVQQGGGGGFMRSAMTTAAGVAGGMLAANAISNMMGGHAAHAAAATPATPTPAAASPVADPASNVAASDENDPGTYEEPDAAEYDDNDPGFDGGSDE